MSPPVVVLLYPGCIFFEIALAAEVLAARYSLRYLTPDGGDLTASNGLRLRSDGAFDRLDAPTPAAVLVPGGDPRSVLEPPHPALPRLRALADAGVTVAGICAGNLVLAAAGVLRGRRGTHNYTAEHAPQAVVAAVAPFWQGLTFERADLVEDGPVITAQHWADRDLAALLGQRLGVLDPVQAQRLRDAPARLRVNSEVSSVANPAQPVAPTSTPQGPP
ncbi:MAG: DJ-1/PfpI family protein [Rubrivivax sp.]